MVKIKSLAEFHRSRNKKAIIRIIEAFIGVMIVFTVVLLIISRQRLEAARSDELVKLQKQVIDYIKVTESLRSQLLINNTAGVNDLLNRTVPSWINYSTRVCDVDKICSNPAGVIKQQVYASELLLTANRTYYPSTATRLVIYFWIK
jgi:hypothetical protein